MGAKKKSGKRVSKKIAKPAGRGKPGAASAAPLDPVAAALARRRLALIAR